MQVALTIQWDTQHDSPNQSTFAALPYPRLTRRAYITTPAAVQARFLPPWRCFLVALRKVRRGHVTSMHKALWTSDGSGCRVLGRSPVAACDRQCS